MRTTVQAIRYTADTDRWHALAAALGLRAAFPPVEAWSEFDGDGMLAVHASHDGSAARTDLHLLVDDLDAAAAALTSVGAVIERTELADVGPILIVRAASGVTLTVSAQTRALVEPTDDPVMTVQPIWYDTDSGPVAAILSALGLRPTIASDSGTWIEFRSHGARSGSVAFHAAETAGVTLALATDGDLETLVSRLVEAGFEASIVDEAYNRTLRVVTPDGDELWVAGPYDDLYGYRRLDS